MEKNKNRLHHPFHKTTHSLLYILFGLELILILIAFVILGGYRYFTNDNANDAIIISLGMLAFISVFFGFVFKDGFELSFAFSAKMNAYLTSVEDQYKEKVESKTATDRDVKDHKAIVNGINEYKILVNPFLWFCLSIFIFICTLVVSIANFNFKGYILSFFIYLGILMTLFLLTSILSLMNFVNKFSQEFKK